jgi:hypothetical protein
MKDLRCGGPADLGSMQKATLRMTNHEIKEWFNRLIDCLAFLLGAEGVDLGFLGASIKLPRTGFYLILE